MTATDTLTIAVPSKGRLMDDTLSLLARAGLTVEKVGHERGYRGRILELEDVDVAFLSASEISFHLGNGSVHMGVTGEDLLYENVPDADSRVSFDAPLGFGHADVVIAVPEAWLDVNTMIDLDDISAAFYARHGRRLRVATKYLRLTRDYFSRMGVSGYRIVESLGATEGAPAAGTAEVVVDITSTGSTLAANKLKILDDGIMLKSQANLVSTTRNIWTPRLQGLREDIRSRVVVALGG